MKNTKKLLSFILVLCIAIGAIVALTFTTGAVYRVEAPKVDDDYHRIFANGNTLYIEAGTNGGTAIYYFVTGETIAYVNPSGAAGDDLSEYSIYGGPYGYNFDGESHIKMTGGKVDQIFGTGGGSTTTETFGEVDDVIIEISGGEVTEGVYAGLNSHIKEDVVIEITGGKVGKVYGCLKSTNYNSGSTVVSGSSTVTITGSAVVTGEVTVGNGYNVVHGARTLVATVPVTLKYENNVSSTEYYYHNLFYKNGSNWVVKGHVNVPYDAEIIINEGESFTIPAGASVTNRGTIVNNGGNVKISGSITNVGNYGTTTCNDWDYHTFSYECDAYCDLCGTQRYGVSHKKEYAINDENTGFKTVCEYCGIRTGRSYFGSLSRKYDTQRVQITMYTENEMKGEKVTITVVDSNGKEWPYNGIYYPGTYTFTASLDNAPEVTFTKTFVISLGELTVLDDVSVSYIFGEDYKTKTITARVGIEYPYPGNTTRHEIVTGNWEFVWDNSSSRYKAKFVPTGEYADYVEELPLQLITLNMAPATPVITLSSPVHSIMPGMTINMDYEVANPYTTGVLLPPDLMITYKVGENGSPVTVSGTSFTLPESAALGETLYVTMSSEAHMGYYTEGTSNTVELFIGQVNYTEDIKKVQENLDNAIAELNAAIAEGNSNLTAEIDNLKGAMTNAQNAIAALQNDSATKAELKALENTLKQADSEIINAYTKAIDDAKSELNTLIEAAKEAAKTDNNDLENTLRKLINVTKTDLEALIEDAKDYADTQDAALKEELTDVINSTKEALEAADKQLQNNIDAAIKKAADELEAARVDLQEKIDNNAETIATEVARLDKLIEDTEAFLLSEDARNRKELEDALAEAKETLKAAIDKVADDLEAARADLQEKIDYNTETIATEVSRLDRLVADTKAVLEAADAKNRAELERALETAKTTLKRSIDRVSSRLTNTQNVLLNVIRAGDIQLGNRITEINTALAEALALLETKTVEADASLKAELVEKIEAADKALDEAIKTVQKNLDDAKAELSKAIADGDTALTEKLEALESALKAAETALKSADDTNKAELLAAIETAKADLTRLINDGDKQNADALASAMVVLRAEMEQSEKDAQLVPTILVIIALAGDVVLAACLIISKKKR